MNVLTRKGLAMFLTMAVVISICNSSYSYVVANTGIFYATEEEMVSLRTISSVSTGAAITTGEAITTSPDAMTIVPEQEEKSDDNKMVIAVETPELQKIEKTLKEVRKELNKGMDLSKPSGLSKKKFVKLIRNMDYDYTGVFKRNAEYIWTLAHTYHFNEIFFVGIIANESRWGSSEKAIATNNYTSQMMSVKQEKKVGKKTKTIYVQKLRPYKSEKECLKETAQNLGKNYLRKKGKFYAGVTVYDVNEHYCVPGVHNNGKPYKYKWADGVYGCMKMILR